MADETEKLDLSKLSMSVPTTKSPNHRVVYVNSSRMGVSPWDVRVILGQVSEVADGQQNQDEVTLVMSPQHAKIFLRNFETTIATYEGMFGKITDLTDVIEKAKRDAVGPKQKLKRQKT